MWKRLCFLALIPLALSAEVRLAIDVGSESVGYMIAQVPGQTLDEGEIPLALEQALENSGTGIIGDEAEGKLIATLNEIVAKAKELKARRYALVGTGALRHARNCDQLTQRILDKTGLELDIITTREEAMLGFEGTVAATDFPRKHLVVWDLGGGTMEIAAGADTFAFDLGSDPFRRQVISKIQGENPNAVASPNPMTREQIDAAIELAASYVPKIPAGLQIEMASGCLVGIGAFAFLGEDPTLDELRAALLQMVGKTDQELGGGPFVGDKVTNYCLTVAFMQTLRIEKLHTAHVDLTDGLLLVGAYQRPL